ncbi:hypothetical protein LRN48_14930, partial [Staphylococcus aureus]
MDFEVHALCIMDELLGEDMHDVVIPLYFAPGVEVSEQKHSELILRVGNKRFRVWWPADSGYAVSVED